MASLEQSATKQSTSHNAVECSVFSVDLVIAIYSQNAIYLCACNWIYVCRSWHLPTNLL